MPRSSRSSVALIDIAVIQGLFTGVSLGLSRSESVLIEQTTHDLSVGQTLSCDAMPQKYSNVLLVLWTALRALQ